MSFGFVAIAGATLAGGAIASSASKSSAKTQAAASDRSSEVQLQMFQEGQEATAPWRETGERALTALEKVYGLDGSLADRGPQSDPYSSFEAMQDRLREGFQESPGQAYQLEQAQLAANRALGAKGFSGSGAEMKEMQRIAQGQASQEYGNYLGQFGDYTNALRSMAGQGQTSAGQSASQAAATGANIGAGYQQAGAAAAQSEIAQANIYSNMIGQGAQAFGMYQGMQQPQAPGGSAYGLPAGSTSYDPYGMRPETGTIQYA